MDALSRPSAPGDPRILLELDLINHQQRHVKPAGICPTECSVIFLKASREVHPRGIQKLTLLLSGKDTHNETEERDEGREGRHNEQMS